MDWIPNGCIWQIAGWHWMHKWALRGSARWQSTGNAARWERVTGQAGVLPISPLFKKNLRVIAEYTGDDVNVGFDWKLWKHLLIKFSLQNGSISREECASASTCYKR